MWEVLELMGLGGTFAKLVKGLLAAASYKVYVNGSFTEEIPLSRGVRQGCPLYPLLFSLSTQPLMDYIQQKLEVGELEGVKVHEGLMLCHRLFADDVGIFIPIFIPVTKANFIKLQ